MSDEAVATGESEADEAQEEHEEEEQEEQEGARGERRQLDELDELDAELEAALATSDDLRSAVQDVRPEAEDVSGEVPAGAQIPWSTLLKNVAQLSLRRTRIYGQAREGRRAPSFAPPPDAVADARSPRGVHLQWVHEQHDAWRFRWRERSSEPPHGQWREATLYRPFVVFLDCPAQGETLPQDYRLPNALPQFAIEHQCAQVAALQRAYFQLSVPFAVLATYLSPTQLDLRGVHVEAFQHRFELHGAPRRAGAVLRARATLLQGERATRVRGALELDFASQTARFRDADLGAARLLYGSRSERGTVIPHGWVLATPLEVRDEPDYRFERALKRAFLQREGYALELLVRPLGLAAPYTQALAIPARKSLLLEVQPRHSKLFDQRRWQLRTFLSSSEVSDEAHACLLRAMHGWQFASTPVQRQLIVLRAQLFFGATDEEKQTGAFWARLGLPLPVEQQRALSATQRAQLDREQLREEERLLQEGRDHALELAQQHLGLDRSSAELEEAVDEAFSHLSRAERMFFGLRTKVPALASARDYDLFAFRWLWLASCGAAPVPPHLL